MREGELFLEGLWVGGAPEARAVAKKTPRVGMPLLKGPAMMMPLSARM